MTPENFLLLLGLSFFFGLAFEEIRPEEISHGPGGVRTFPLLALSGAALFVLDPKYLSVFSVGLFVLGLLLYAYYRNALEAPGPKEHPSLLVPVSSVLAYLLGPITLKEPHWVPISLSVASVFFLGGRERLHHLAETIPRSEILTVGKFLVLTGIILPILPDHPVVSFMAITPYQVWKAVVVVSSLSYGSYLFQKILTPKGGFLLAAVMGGFYSSTAATVLLSRRGREEPSAYREISSAIILANSLMYIRIGLILMVLNPPVAKHLSLSLGLLFLLGFCIALFIYLRGERKPVDSEHRLDTNPLELNSAFLFAGSYIVISILTAWVKGHFGPSGIYALAGFVGVTDIVPFVLSVAQVGQNEPMALILTSIMIAASSNNVIKAIYAAVFWGVRPGLPSILALLGLAAGGIVLALY
jgi:uncharacterized membrane protein (DUF4010 family)